MSRQSKKYRAIYEQRHGEGSAQGLDIHHINGDKTDNSVDNLQAVTVEEHYRIHENQGDWGACKALSLRLSQPPAVRSEMSKKLWRDAPPGRKPVTDGNITKQLKTDEDVEQFLQYNKGWRRGRAIADDSGFRQVGRKKLEDGSHVMLQKVTCPHCDKTGHAVVMKRWHFDNCRHK